MKLIQSFFDAIGLKGEHKPAADATRKGESQYDAIIVGAGVSGLAAAKALHSAKYRVVILEANNRIGGRILTDRSSGVELDLGASWVHGTKGNPIVRLLRDAGASLRKTDFNSHIVYLNGLKAKDIIDANNFYQYIEQLKENIAGDESLAIAFERYVTQNNISDERKLILQHIVFTNMETEFGVGINSMSVKSFNEDEEYKGGDAMVTCGYDCLTEELARGLNIHLKSPVDAVRDTGAGVIVSVGRNEYHARYVVVTVSLGVLQKGVIKFSPSLSFAKTRALSGLGMGNLHKTFLEFAHNFWDDVQAIDIVRGEGRWREFINLQKETRKPILLALHAGEDASKMKNMSNEEIVLEADSVLKTVYAHAVPPLKVLTTTWEDDPYILGSYSFVPVGSSLDMYDDIARPQGRFFFAGEHTNRAYPSTVHGAYLSGIRAAKILTGRLGSRPIKFPTV